MQRGLFILAVLSAQPVVTAQRPLSVCELLTQLQRNNGKNVIVRGYIEHSEEMTYVSGTECPDKVVTKGFVWPSAIVLEPPGYPGALAPTDFEAGESSKQALKSALAEAELRSRRGARFRVLVTVTGRLETRTKFVLFRAPDGELMGNGFGHLAGFPAQIIYRSFSEIKITRVSDAHRPRDEGPGSTRPTK